MSDLARGIEKQIAFAGAEFSLGEFVVNRTLMGLWVIGERDDCPVGDIVGRGEHGQFLVRWHPGTSKSHVRVYHHIELMSLPDAQQSFLGLADRIASLAMPAPQEDEK